MIVLHPANHIRPGKAVGHVVIPNEEASLHRVDTTCARSLVEEEDAFADCRVTGVGVRRGTGKLQRSIPCFGDPDRLEAGPIDDGGSDGQVGPDRSVADAEGPGSRRCTDTKDLERQGASRDGGAHRIAGADGINRGVDVGRQHSAVANGDVPGAIRSDDEFKVGAEDL